MDDGRRKNQEDFWSLAQVKPEGYPFYDRAERSWAEGAARHTETRELVVWGQRIVQEWTLIVHGRDHEPPGAFDQRVYEALSGYRSAMNAEGERSITFAPEEISEMLFGRRSVDLQREILASIKRMLLCHMTLDVIAEDGRGRRSGGNWMSGYEIAESGSPGGGDWEVTAEIRFSTD